MDLEEMFESLEIAPSDRPRWLAGLAVEAYHQYELTGSREAIDRSIQFMQVSVHLAESDEKLSGFLNNLGIMLGRRYERTGQMADLEDAIIAARQAVDSTPEDHPDRAGFVDSLGNKLESRYERTGQMADLEEAIIIARQAVEAMPEDHPYRAACLNNLGNKLESRYERTGQMADLENAITAAYQAMESTPEDHPNRAGRLNNLGNKLESRYERTGQIADLENAITAARQAVESTPEDHPNRAGRLNNLGNKLESRYKRTGQMTDLDQASRSFFTAWHCTVAIPFHRVKAGAQCLKLLIAQQDLVKAAELGQNIIRLMPAVSTKLLDRNDQQVAVSTFAGVASNLCAIFLELGRHEDALLYLEQGRTFIIGQLIDRQRDISDLALSNPDTAQRYEELLREVSAQPRSAENDNIRHRTSSRQSAAVDEMMACITYIRTLPGHERFLLGQTVAQMKETAKDGNIVIINLTHFRTDAIIVSATNVKTLPLPGLSADRARAWLSKDWTTNTKYKGRRALEENRKKNDEFLLYLEWLWQGGVDRILNEIRIQSQETPGRVWWIGSGLAATMPFHAAGKHTTAGADHACRVVSSYSPSIKALAFSRSKAARVTEVEGPLLMATMNNTPKARDAKRAPAMLAGVDEERRAVLVAASGRLRVHDLAHPSADQVLAGLQDCSIAHLACHGHTDSKDPSSSHLILQKGEEIGLDVEQDLLTVHLVSKLKLGKARLAYLSACSTAQNTAEKLSDEVIHVVSGFQMAGFPHVVGCLWPANDGACIEVADDFYKSLLERSAWWEGDHVAKAVQSAVMKLRKQMVEMPLIWAPFVHYGA